MTKICKAVLLIAGTAGAAFFSIPAAIILFAVLCAVFAIQHIEQKASDRRLVQLCEAIDRILHGADHLDFSDSGEDATSILAAEIRKMTVRLREQNQSLRADREFLKESLEDISHQLRTPLTSIMLLLNSLRRPDLTKQQQTETVRELFTLLSRMQWMIETLLSLSRLDAGAVQFHAENVSCTALLRAALEPIEIALELKGVAVNIQAGSNPILRIDRSYTAEALTNLLKNCMEHTPADGTITIQAVENPLYTGLLITDTGEGISAQDLPHIFERFYRGSGFAKQGYGIGMAFARKIICAQNGSIQARSAQPHGAQFDIRFYGKMQ